MTEPPLPEESIFARALEIPSAEGRAAFLDRACGGDAALRAGVESLLRADARAGDLLDWPDRDTTIDDPVRERPGTLVGPYRLMEEIGEGGMGLVFVAEQQRPVRRKVALKVIKPGMDSRHVVARFEAERQALSLMDHPNIARVFDGGETGSGRPYFVMELVKGVPITQFCDDNQLSVRQRLELFLDLCAAVQHAHQKGIIHRDLKPSNVLVTLHDTTPVVKVIDFGVAKAVGQSLTEKTLYTQWTQMVGTPLYMSPEQAGLSGLDVDTRTDVYALGVLLYELLTGQTPFDRERLRTVGFDEIRRIIREEEPPRPSARLSTLGQAAQTVSANRQTDLGKLRRLVRGELDWVVMKALEKDRNRRYESPGGLAADLQRYLHDEPVLACPPSASYRLGKFVRRNRTGLAVAGLVFVFTAALGAGAGWVMHERSTRQSRREAQVEEVLKESVASYRQRKLAEALVAIRQARALLEPGHGGEGLRHRVERLRSDLEFAVALEEADLQRTAAMTGNIWATAPVGEFASAFRDYGIDLEALPPAEAARRIAASAIREHLIDALDQWSSYSTVPPEWKDRLLAVANLADDDPWRRELRSGARKDRKALQGLAAAPGTDGQSAAALHLLGMSLQNQGDHATAVRLLSRARSRYPGDFWINYRLGVCLGPVKMHRPDGGLRYLTAAVALRPESPGAHVMLGMYLRRHSPDEAAAAFQEAIRLQPTYADAHHMLGYFRMIEGKDAAAALGPLTRAIELVPAKAAYWEYRAEAWRRLKQLDKALADANAATVAEPGRAMAWCARGTIQHDMRQFDKAVADLTRAVELKPDYYAAQRARGFAYLELGQPAAAIADFAALLAVVPNEEMYLRARAFAFRDSGQAANAIAVFTALLAVRRNDAALWMSRGDIYRAEQKHSEAAEDFSAAIRLRPKDPNAWAGRGYAHSDLNQRDKALADLSRALELEPARGLRWLFRGKAHWQFGDQAKALEDVNKAVELDPMLVEGWLMKGHANHRLGRKEAALAAYSEAVARAPRYSQAWSDRGRLFVELGQWARATADFGKVVEGEPGMPSVWHHWAVALLGAGNKVGHRDACAAMLARFRGTPDPSTAARVVSACVVAPGPEPAALLKLAELAATVDSDWNAGFLGAARFRAKQFRPALESFEHKARSQPRRAWDLLFTAMIHHRLGHAAQARACLDEARGWLAKVGPPPHSGGPVSGWSNWEEEVETRALLQEAEALLAARPSKPKE